MAKILIVDDDKGIRNTLRDILELEKYKVDDSPDGLDAIVKLKQNDYDVIIMDIKMPKMDGMEALERIQILKPDIPVIMISGHGNIDTAVDSVKKGAFDFIQKPPDLNRLFITIRNAMDKSSLITEKNTLQRKVTRKSAVQEIIGNSAPIQFIKETIDTVAPTEARVLVTGSNGAGKELVARWLHEKSNRNANPIVEVNCAAIPSELIESELFGHEKGSFTSAHKQRIGKFELASGGTLFLDEIGDMSLSAQAKVLRALQESRITRVGGEKEIRVDVRVVAATNKDLRAEISKGKFREDLYHRLAVILIDVPALNDRRDDIPQLVEHFVKNICLEYGTPIKKVDATAMELLKENNWTGNIRELRNVVERLIILSGDQIGKKDVQNYVVNNADNRSKLQSILDQFDSEEKFIEFAREQFEKYKGVPA
ncbi:MAG: sigma-54-dependent Fis family transcriptional regulator [Saprospiraceae bacterium]|jgi:two-component system, NtrC family, nitrogen regulation response regulator NtrX|nr:sigma-54-dependent Fis family transcriptional regulator [Saprospiraceae bacterium]MDA9182642.1 sigma-54 dependent transcriptional regulator [Saprospiraceae bacterium]HAV29795.1 response regulator [Saprospirales bacterium]